MARKADLDLVKVPLRLPWSLDCSGEGGIVAQHKQPPLGIVVCFHHLIAHQLQHNIIESLALALPITAPCKYARSPNEEHAAVTCSASCSRSQ